MQEVARSNEIKPGSERSFGLLFCAVFVIVALWPLMSDGGIRWWAVIIAALFGAAGLVVPAVLRPLNLLWFRFGMLLHAVVSPLILGLIFLAVVVPTGLLLRLFGKDVLDIKSGAGDRSSYWIKRNASATVAESMRNQF